MMEPGKLPSQFFTHWMFLTSRWPVGSSIMRMSALNEMCTHIVDFHERKLRQFKAEKGKVLQQFVEAYPEKASYFELTDKNEQWIFPVPGILEGVKSRGK